MTYILTEGPDLLADNSPQAHRANTTIQRVLHVDKLDNQTSQSFTDALPPSSSTSLNRGLSFDSGRGAVDTQDCTVAVDAAVCMTAGARSAAAVWKTAGADHANSSKIAITKRIFRNPILRKEITSISARIVMGSATHA